MSRVGVYISVIIVLCHSIRLVPNTWELSQLDKSDHKEPPEWLEEISALSHLLITLSCSVNWSVFIFFCEITCRF